MKKRSQIICHFFDQNVMEKMSKKNPESLIFQNNIKQTFMKSRINQALTPFSFLEFIGVQSKDILKVSYAGRDLKEYPCKYEELQEIISFLKNHIKTTVTKKILEDKWSKKKESKHLSKLGMDYIKKYHEYFIESKEGYENLLLNLYLDSLSQVDISGFSQEENNNFSRYEYNPLILKSICDMKRTMGSFKIMIKSLDSTCQEVKRKAPKDVMLNQNRKNVQKIREDLHIKPYSDLVDCELIHLACFGYYNNHCHCYTTDDPNKIKNRLVFYCEGVLFIEKWFYEFLPKNRPEWKSYCEKYLPKNRPQWKCGRVFVLDKRTGEKIKIIPVKKIYDEIKKYQDFSFKNQ